MRVKKAKRSFPIGKRSFPYKNSESCRKDLRDWSKVEGQKILHLPAKLRMIPGEKLILHGRRSISASCKALELECRGEDFFKKKDFFFGASKTLAKTLIPGTWRDPHESGLWPIAQIVNWSPYALGTRTEL